MICDECGRNNAEVMITTIVNGQSVSKHLCRQCVKKYQNGSIHGVLAAVLATMAQKQQVADDSTCPACQMTFSEFQKTGLLGCADCYQAFRSQLTDLLTRVQGRTQHAGKCPERGEQTQRHLSQIGELRAKMEEAIAAEDYEQAAVYRDRIREAQAEFDRLKAEKARQESEGDLNG